MKEINAQKGRRSWKYSISLFLVLIMVVGLVGCSKEKKSEVSDKKNDSEMEEKLPLTELTLPLSEEKITFTMWTVFGSMVDGLTDPSQIEAVKRQEELTNVHIDYTCVDSSSATEKFGMLLASGNYPDMIDMGTYVEYPGGGDKGIADGILLELNDYVENYMPNYKKLIESDETVRKMTRTDSGKMWSLKTLFCNDQGELLKEPTWLGLYIRQDWLDKCGKKVPVTIADWEDVLTAFKEQMGADAPLLIGNTGFINYDAFATAYGVLEEFYQENGLVKYGPIEEGYREYVELMADWYTKGLIDPNFLSNSNGFLAADEYTLTGRSGAWQSAFSVAADYQVKAGAVSDPDFYLTAVQPPVLKEGDTTQSAYISYIARANFAITTSCKQPEIAAQWLDFAYTIDGMLLNHYGIEGVHYNKTDSGYEYSDFIFNNPDGYNKFQARALAGRGDTAGLSCWTKLNKMNDETALAAREVWTEAGNDLVLPDITLTEEEGSEYRDIYADIKTYVQENTVKFILGTKQMSEWEDFVNTIKGMNIERCIEINQNALERYENR